MSDRFTSSAAAIEPAHYQAFRSFLEQASGIVLGDSKQYLVASRLGPLMAEHGFRNLGELVTRLQQGGQGRLRAQVVEAMTTNETQFFRDGYPFEALRETIIPELRPRLSRPLRIWSAGCSSGQEAYSISITIQEMIESGIAVEAEIIGTDIAEAMVRQAAEGRYSAAAVARGLSQERLRRYFQPVGDDSWQVRPEVRRRTSFRQHNLLESFALLGRFDVIFCRNVLIYFSQELRRDILKRMAEQLHPGGYLIVGGSESLMRQTDAFDMIRCSGGVIYRLKDLTAEKSIPSSRARPRQAIPGA